MSAPRDLSSQPSDTDEKATPAAFWGRWVDDEAFEACLANLLWEFPDGPYRNSITQNMLAEHFEDASGTDNERVPRYVVPARSIPCPNKPSAHPYPAPNALVLLHCHDPP